MLQAIGGRKEVAIANHRIQEYVNAQGDSNYCIAAHVLPFKALAHFTLILCNRTYFASFMCLPKFHSPANLENTSSFVQQDKVPHFDTKMTSYLGLHRVKPFDIEMKVPPEHYCMRGFSF
jgi:hypothetical protein